MESHEIIKPKKEVLGLSSLDSKIDFNRNLFRKELEDLKNKGINLNFKIDELIKKVRSVETGESILDFIKYKNKNYNLHIRKSENKESDNGYRLDIYNEKENFKTFRSENPHVAGWVGQGRYIFKNDENDNYDLTYNSEDHWGVSVTNELKGSGLADVLYNLKSQVDNQPEFEHASGGNLSLITFYIKKGYVPYSLIKLDPIREEIIDKDELVLIVLGLKKSRMNPNQSFKKDYALKLKLDPAEAMKIYSDIEN